jgi:hypothetical protein
LRAKAEIKQGIANKNDNIINASVKKCTATNIFKIMLDNASGTKLKDKGSIVRVIAVKNENIMACTMTLFLFYL